MGCRNIHISVALTYQLLRLIGLSLVWRCLSRGIGMYLQPLASSVRCRGRSRCQPTRSHGKKKSKKSPDTIFFKSVKKWMSHWEKKFHHNLLKVSSLYAFVFHFDVICWKFFLQKWLQRIRPWLLEEKDKDKCLEKRGEMESECAWMKNSHVAAWSDSHPPFSRGWKIKINPGKSEPPKSSAEETSLYY